MINHHTNVKKLKKMDDKELKKNLANILFDFADFCEKNNLRYLITWGTLLGCIRHKGFIPWDDDIDLMMPREDYEKLREIVAKNDYTINKDYYKLATANNKYSIHMPLFRVLDMRTVCDSKKRCPKYWLPLWIDIMPVDHVPKDNKVLEKEFFRFNRSIAHMSFAIYNSNRKQDSIKKIIGKIEEPFMDYFINKYDKRLSTIGKPDDGYFDFSIETSNLDHGKTFADFVFDKSIFDNYVYKSFEGHKIRVPKNYDELLTLFYNDYMQLPPEDKRVSHSNGVYWLKDGELYGEKPEK